MTQIRPMLPSDWPPVRHIYERGIATGIATFETKIPDWEQWNEKHITTCRLVACREEKVVGWAALSPVSHRWVYRGVGEVSVYVHPDFRGRSIGFQLMKTLIAQSEKAGFWTLQSGIFSENKASILLHLKVNFREIGYREKVAQLDGVWKDNVLMERRSPLF